MMAYFFLLFLFILIFEGGNVGGFSSMIVLFPDSDLVITILSNVFAAMLPNTIPYYLADEILNLPRTKDWIGKETMDRTEKVYKAKADAESREDLPPRLKNKPAAHPLSDYAGVYTHPLFDDFKITLETEEDIDGVEQDELHFYFTTYSSKVEHYHFETFTFVFDAWSVKAKGMVTFVTGENGHVEALQLEYLDETWTLKKQSLKETLPSSSSNLLMDMETATARHHCDDQEEQEIDIGMKDEQEEKQTVFGQNQIQFKLF